ncbi:MAG: chemotaxis protein CheB, partial [Bdellovibrionia bacterium]
MRAISTPKTKAKSLEAAPRVHTEDTAFPVVGIGASAGGLEAFTKLFSNLPPDTGMAFVLIQHLSPQHESLLPEIISRATTMSVVEVKDRTRVVPNHVYVIPPNATMGFHDGCLRLTPRGEHEQPHLPIDFFFRSLSDEMKTNAIGIVLSGTGSDGSEGLKVLKGEGGISFAQEPDSARFKGMPQRAINVDHLDFILPPEQIALELLKISRLPFVHASLSGATIDQDIHETADTDKILTLVRQSTGVDFLRYKRTTVRRRILRRMAVNKVERFSDYYALLKESRTEQNALFDDILINVTWFFRDPEEYERMKAVIFPALIKNRRLGDPIRVWSAGCATGEEAYSIAIALLEYLGDKLGHYPIQIFASDLSESCIAKARTGKYTDSISENVSPERLAKFFVKSDAGYQVNKLVRDLCVFAKQDLVNDPPYSKLDFISCRNVLIYLESSLQQKALTVFNYVLKPTGFLVLGISETPNVAAKFFNRIGKKGKIYSVNPKSAQARPVFTNSKNLVDNTFSGGGRASFSSVALDTVERETDRLLAAHYAPPSVVINENLEIIQFRGDTSPFLVNQTGRANFQILKMARDILAPHLKSLIEAAKKGAAAKSGSIKVRNGDKLVLVSLEVIPVRALSTSRCFLILFTKPDASSSAQD